MKNRSFTIRLDEKVFSRLEALGQKENETCSELARRFILLGLDDAGGRRTRPPGAPV